MFFQNLLMKNMKGFRPLHLLNMLSYSSFVYAFANVLKRCVVTMVSNVSDSSDAWPGMLLHAHVTAFSNDKQSRLHTRTHAYLVVYIHIYLCMYVCALKVHKYMQPGKPISKTSCIQICVFKCKAYGCKSEKRCMSGRNSCSFLHEQRNFLLLFGKQQPVSQDINQSAMLRLYAGS